MRKSPLGLFAGRVLTTKKKKQRARTPSANTKASISTMKRPVVEIIKKYWLNWPKQAWSCNKFLKTGVHLLSRKQHELKPQ